MRNKRKTGKVVIQFKDPDAIFAVVEAKHPFPDDEDQVTPKMEKDRRAFMDKYFEFGDYGQIEIDAETTACRLLPRREWV